MYDRLKEALSKEALAKEASLKESGAGGDRGNSTGPTNGHVGEAK